MKADTENTEPAGCPLVTDSLRSTSSGSFPKCQSTKTQNVLDTCFLMLHTNFANVYRIFINLECRITFF